MLPSGVGKRKNGESDHDDSDGDAKKRKMESDSDNLMDDMVDAADEYEDLLGQIDLTDRKQMQKFAKEDLVDHDFYNDFDDDFDDDQW